jgi:hypothetical protein
MNDGSFVDAVCHQNSAVAAYGGALVLIAPRELQNAYFKWLGYDSNRLYWHFPLSMEHDVAKEIGGSTRRRRQARYSASGRRRGVEAGFDGAWGRDVATS